MAEAGYREAAKGLGAVEVRYASPLPARAVAIVGVVFVVPGVLLLGGVASGPGEVLAGDRRTNAGIGIALIAFALVAMVQVLRKATLQVIVHANGFEWLERGVARKVMWSEVAAIRGKHRLRKVAGVDASESSVYRITLESGRELVATHMLGDVHALARRVEQAVEEHQLPRLRQRHQDGEPVAFGPVVVTKDGVEVSGTAVTWGNLDVVDVDDGTLRVRRKTGKPLEVPWADVPNAQLLLTLVKR